jgi:hypothetical protein
LWALVLKYALCRWPCRYGWELGEEELLAGIEALEAERRRPNFGNAGSANNLLSAAAMRMEERLKGVPPAQRATLPPVAADFLPPKPPRQAGVFDDLVGCQ